MDGGGFGERTPFVIQQDQVQPPLAVLILGPTGSGKTALSLALGEAHNGEIVSCDSIAVYRGMDFGSAKPSLEEQALTPHHLIDVADPDEVFSAGEYSRQARAALRDIARRTCLPIVTGGTGLYLRALTMGLSAGPTRHQELRDRLVESHERKAAGWLHRVLLRLDRTAANRIHANDTPKLIRAIEICLASGKPITDTFASGRDPLTGFRLLKIGLNPPRQALYEHLNQRAAAMFQNGLVEETRSLLVRYGRVQPLHSLGYRQALSVIDGTQTTEAALASAQQGHRNYAKRQLTWFRRESDVHWFQDFGNSAAVLASAGSLMSSHLV